MELYHLMLFMIYPINLYFINTLNNNNKSSLDNVSFNLARLCIAETLYI